VAICKYSVKGKPLGFTLS